MAILKVVSPKNHYKDAYIYRDVISYIINPDKAPQQYIWTQGVRSIHTAAQDMETLTDFHKKNHGTRIRHMILSFSPSEPIGLRQAFDIEQQVIAFFAPDYQMVGAIHAYGREHLHIHFIMNPVRISDGKKYKGSPRDYYLLRSYINSLLKEYKSYLRN